MKIDSKKITLETQQAFQTSKEQIAKFNLLDSYVSSYEYKSLHKKFLTATTIKIDIELFLDEINLYSDQFQPWGTKHKDIPRYGLALVNQNGMFNENDPINGSLHEWNKLYPSSPIIETDCQKLTDAMSMISLRPLRIFDNHWCRSNILKWHTGAHFKPHIDTVLPSPWLRLWATTDSDNLDIRYDQGDGTLIKFENIEKGRVYIIDTSIVHDAISYSDNVYQLFLSTLPSSINILKEHLCLE